jgi:adenylylsulfate kinase
MTGVVVWLTGLPASGKSTLADRVAARLRAMPRPIAILDGDAVRAALRPVPGYDEPARCDYYETLGNLALLLSEQGLVVIVAATAHRRAWRDRIRAPGALIEVHVATPLEECLRRDPKGLYRSDAAALPGTGVEYEAPAAADVVANGGHDERALDEIIRRIERHAREG